MSKKIFESKNFERTEEIQTIIERIPTKFGTVVTIFVSILMAVLFIFGWIIRYPDIISGEITINSNVAPIKLVANSSGKLYLNNIKSMDIVKEGDYLAVIENSANLSDIRKLYNIIKKFNINIINDNSDLVYPRNLAIGDLNLKYYAFIEALNQYLKQHKTNLLIKQEEVLRKVLVEQENILKVSNQKLIISDENVRLIKKFHKRDSVLYSQKVLTEAEIDKSDMNLLSAKDAYHTMHNNLTTIREKIQESNSKIQQIKIQKNEEEEKIRLNLLRTYTDLADNFKVWEQKFALKAPIDGRVQFSKFWTNNQFIQAGENVLTVVPKSGKIIGQMMLPALGAGKVKAGQEVIIKLDNYPYKEYGSIKGKVLSISLTTNSFKTENGEISIYLVSIELPDKLKTNYGTSLDFKFEIKGSAEIITNDRKLVERLFDNLKYSLVK
ncbi:HlyD family secretion protein [Pedobacter glucosidilyticus]|uniref:HlyD family secretion protein n=1 Tax=Pedobacter glucosidilyticus TaxID=1122941 RepID=UPI0026EE760B|nr:HlyD family efflux transporter periplasmic adaptor subunit [Pedobacter glucosidilyticus]